MARLTLLALLLAGTAWAGTAKAPKTAEAMIEDKLVFIGKPILAQPTMEVRNLRFWDGKIAETGAQCTIVAGELWNMTDVENWTVTVEIQVRGGGITFYDVGTAKATIVLPGKHVPVPFRLLLPPGYDAANWKKGCRFWHTERITVQ